jgi:hypothetical protein
MDSPAPVSSLRFPASTPSAVFMRLDDNIRVTSYNALASVGLTIRARVMTEDGTIDDSVDTQTPNTDRTAKTTIVRTDEGWLLGGQVVVTSAAPLVGQTFVVVEIIKGDTANALALQLLAAGYVSAKQPLMFPQVIGASSLDGGGALRSITGTTPAAGAEISETVPTGARWELLAFKALLTASATVANRLARLTIDDGVNVFWDTPSNTAQTASQAIGYRWAQGLAQQFADSITNQFQAFPGGLRLLGGSRIRTTTTNIQAGDQWSAVQYLVREWIEGA